MPTSDATACSAAILSWLARIATARWETGCARTACRKRNNIVKPVMPQSAGDVRNFVKPAPHPMCTNERVAWVGNWDEATQARKLLFNSACLSCQEEHGIVLAHD